MEPVTLTLGENGRIEVDGTLDQIPSTYVDLYNDVADIDEKLDAGSETAGKRKFQNELVDRYKPVWEPASAGIIKELTREDWSDEKRAGVYLGMLRTVEKAVKDQIEKFVTSQVEALPKPEDAPSDDEKKELATVRQGLVDKVKALFNVAESLGLSTEDSPWPTPKRRGAVGKRGARLITQYDWTVDGTDMEDEENNLSGVSQKLGFESYGKFTQALRDLDIDTTNPPVRINATVNGHNVVGVRRAAAEDSSTEETSESDTPESDSE